MKKEQLIALGLSPEQADNVLKIHKETLDGSYVPKHRFDEITGENKTLKDSLGERDTQISSLRKFEGDATALKDQMKALQEDNKKKESEHQQLLATERKRNAIKLSLINEEEKPHDVDMVMGLFNLDQVAFDETSGHITNGFKEQVDSLRKDKAFLFTPKATPPFNPNPTPGFKIAGTPPIDGDKGGGNLDPAVSFGSGLAQKKLGMMGVNLQDPNTNPKITQ